MFGLFTAQTCQSCGNATPKHDTVRVNFEIGSDKENKYPCYDSLATMEAEPKHDPPRVNFETGSDKESKSPGHDSLAERIAQEEEAATAAAEIANEEKLQRLEVERLERIQQALLRQQEAEANKRAKEEEQQKMAEQLRLEEERKLAERYERSRCYERSRNRADAEKVKAFLSSNGFPDVLPDGVNWKQKSMMSSQYPLHAAVKKIDVDAIRVLLGAGADASLKNSSGQTPLAQARKNNKKDSHNQIIQMLGPS